MPSMSSQLMPTGGYSRVQPSWELRCMEVLHIKHNVLFVSCWLDDPEVIMSKV